MEARGDVDAARQMGQLEAVWSAMGSRRGRLRRHILREKYLKSTRPRPQHQRGQTPGGPCPPRQAAVCLSRENLATTRLFVSSVTRKRYHLVVKIYCTSPLLCNFDGAPRLRNHNSDMGVKCKCESEARDLASHRVDQRIQKKVRRAGSQSCDCENQSRKIQASAFGLILCSRIFSSMKVSPSGKIQLAILGRCVFRPIRASGRTHT